MRVIRVDLPATPKPRDPNVSLAADEVRTAVIRRLGSMEYALAEQIRHRAAAYFPQSYTVFSRLRVDAATAAIRSEIWVVDPSVGWPQGLLARRAWRLFVPVLGHIATEAIEQAVPEIVAAVDEKAAGVTVLGPTRAWRDPLVLGATVFALTTLLWITAMPMIREQLGWGGARMQATATQPGPSAPVATKPVEAPAEQAARAPQVAPLVPPVPATPPSDGARRPEDRARR